ncbi:MAG: protoglobin domain-containing protein [Desulfohalobiaceae bacterium]
MPVMYNILQHYHFGAQDEEYRTQLARILLPIQDQFVEDFYALLEEDTYTASFFPTQESVAKRKQTMKDWLQLMLKSPFDHRMLLKLERIGKTHVRIGLEGHYVNSAINFVRRYFKQVLRTAVPEDRQRDALQETLDKILDISLDIMTSSYREAEQKKVFISKKAEYWLMSWSERLNHGLNLMLMIGLLIMASGVAFLLGSDMFFALTTDVEQGVVRALGSLLILWMMVELLHAQVEQLKGGRFHVRIFVNLALVAFIRKIFVASIEGVDPITFGLLIATLLVLGLLHFLLSWSEKGLP